MSRNRFFGFLLETLFPPRCAGCSAPLKTQDGVCDICRSRIPLYHFAYCPTCKRRIPGPPPHPHASYTLVAATGFRRAPVRHIIHALKYKHQKNLAQFCGVFLAESALRYIEQFHPEISSCIIVPIPLHPRRLRERGFNQSEEIAATFVNRLAVSGISIPFFTDILARVKYTPSQAKKSSKEERISNLKGSFGVSDSVTLAGKTIFLIDDVSTTGTTLREATAALRSAGARHVVAFVFAKTD